jgi:hypothetical protein
MFYILSYRVDKKVKTLKVNEDAAAKVREKLAAGNANQFLTLGLETIRIGQIISLSAESSDKTKGGIKDLKRRLIMVSGECYKCKGDGFVDQIINEKGEIIKKWEPKCEIRKEICECQARVKEGAGFDRDDFSWSHYDEESV